MRSDQLRILIIDDSIADACVLKSLIQQSIYRGSEIVHESTLQTGLAAIRREEFDCVFLDYQLGDDDGLELLEKVRSSDIDVPIITNSGHGCEAIAVRALHLGAQDYLVKGSQTPKAVERALRNAIEKVALARQLEETQQELEQFAAVAAHDLQAPLRTISTCAQWVIEDAAGSLDDENSRNLNHIQTAAGRMQSLLSSLLKYTHIGRTNQEFDEIELDRIMADVIRDLQADITRYGAKIQVASLPKVSGQQESLGQLFQNLISNAIKFCRDRKPEIVVTANQYEDHCVISIADNGIGIARDDQKRIFAPFTRLNKKSEFEGTGLGLATCRRIIKQHGGEIGLESEPGSGTTFHLSLPLGQPEPNEWQREGTRSQGEIAGVC